VNKRNALYKEKPERWAADPDKYVSYEFKWKNIEVKPGVQFKLKNDRNIYTFICLVHNTKLDTTWIECSSGEGFKSVRISRVSKVLVPKRSYKRRD
jgi:hypothetical protein